MFFLSSTVSSARDFVMGDFVVGDLVMEDYVIKG